MNKISIEILMILVLILINGVLAMAEFAVVTARKNRLRQRAIAGDRGALAALDLAQEPSDFLSTVQIGITLVGILAGVFGGATIAEVLAENLSNLSILARYSEGIAVVIVVVFITSLSLVFGELVPKRLALMRPEKLAIVLARPMTVLAKAASPLVRMLGWFTDLLLKVLGMESPDEPSVTEEDLKLLIAQAAQAGVILEAEQDLVAGVFRLGDRRAGTLITPRTEIEWLDLDEPIEINLQKVLQSHHSSFPVARGDIDEVLGVVIAKELLRCCLSGSSIKLENCIVPPVFVPENTPALRVLDIFKTTEPHLVLVIDEYGGLQGLLTIRDILETFVGDIHLRDSSGVPNIYARADGSWLIDGMLPVDEFKEAFQISSMPEYDRGYYATVGGFILYKLGKIPSTGDVFEWGGLRFEVMDMDGLRVDKILVEKTGSATQLNR
jgi:putative hemolysin